MERNNVYIYSKNDAASIEKKKFLTEKLQHENFIVRDNHQDATIIISLGGEGTFLQAVRKTGFRQDCIYAGVSTTGMLTMYCDFQFNDLDTVVESIRSAEIEIRRYPVLEVQVDNNPVFYCLNEFSIRSNIIKTFVLDVYIDDLLFESFRGDGMVVSTPTGSTAYNKSTNGAVVDPMLKCIQIAELASVNNNKYRTLGSSFLLSGARTLVLKINEGGHDYPTMGMDNEALSIRHVEQVTMNLSDRVVKTVKLKNNSFWEKVKRTYL